MRIFVIYILLVINCLGEILNVGEIDILSNDMDFDKYLYIRHGIVHDIFLTLDHPDNLNYSVLNPIVYDGKGDTTGLKNYLADVVKVNIAIIFACDKIPDEVVALIKTLNIHFFAFTRSTSLFSSSLYFMSQPNSVYMTSIFEL